MGAAPSAFRGRGFRSHTTQTFFLTADPFFTFRFSCPGHPQVPHSGSPATNTKRCQAHSNQPPSNSPFHFPFSIFPFPSLPLDNRYHSCYHSKCPVTSSSNCRRNCNLTLRLSLSFQTTCALPKSVDSQPTHPKRLAHSLGKQRGYTHLFPNRNSPLVAPARPEVRRASCRRFSAQSIRAQKGSTVLP